MRAGLWVSAAIAVVGWMPASSIAKASAASCVSVEPAMVGSCQYRTIACNLYFYGTKLIGAAVTSGRGYGVRDEGYSSGCLFESHGDDTVIDMDAVSNEFDRDTFIVEGREDRAGASMVNPAHCVESMGQQAGTMVEGPPRSLVVSIGMADGYVELHRAPPAATAPGRRLLGE